jgi:hypothetical protein
MSTSTPCLEASPLCCLTHIDKNETFCDRTERQTDARPQNGANIVLVFRRLVSFSLLHLFLTLFRPFSYTFCNLKSVIDEDIDGMILSLTSTRG